MSDASPVHKSEMRWERFVLAPTLLLAATALGLLPFVVTSMIAELRGGQTVLYDLRDGQPIGDNEVVDPGAAEFLSVAIVALDEASGSVTLAISGNRSCNPCTTPKRMTFVALDADVSQRRGIAPFATITVPAGETAYSETVTLPVRGSPIRYPFDSYRLRLGLDLPPPESEPADGPPSGTSPDAGHVLGILQSQLTRLSMVPPLLVAHRRQARTRGRRHASSSIWNSDGRPTCRC